MDGDIVFMTTQQKLYNMLKSTCTRAEIDGINDAFITVLKELSLLFCSTDLNMPRDKYFDCYENLKGKQMLKLAFS